jgi:hypothetical protein
MIAVGLKAFSSRLRGSADLPGTAVARWPGMDQKDYRTRHHMATADVAWWLATMLAVFIGLPVVNALLLLFGLDA